jgi:transcriptional regulator of acetoin/glycerol metabolism
VPHAPADLPRPVRPLSQVEREEILNALRVFRGNVPEAARALDMGRATLYKYIKRENIDPGMFAG